MSSVAAQTEPELDQAPPNPFPGLRAYEKEDHLFFFGRDRNIDELLEKLRAQRFIGVVGTSGTGKSSLVKAGVLPRLDGGFQTAQGAFWHVVTMEPGTDPLGNFAAALDRDLESLRPDSAPGAAEQAQALRVELIATALRRSDFGLVRLVREINLPARTNLLIFVDQFEETFRYEGLTSRGVLDDATRFVRLLLSATQQLDHPIFVLITMRVDFMAECVRFDGLPEAISRGQYLVPRLDRNQRREAIQGPVGVAGADLSPGLLQQVLNDVGDDPEQLILLQHAMMQTFERWLERCAGTGPITAGDYLDVGGIREALSRHAEEAYDALNDEEKRVAEVMFRSLTEVGDAGRGVRRPCRCKDILEVSGSTIETISAVIEMFRSDRRNFLSLDPPRSAITPDTVVDIAHESLMRVWGRLGEWSQAERKSAEQLRRIDDAAKRHESRAARLWRDPDLALACRWREEEQPNSAWAQRYRVDYERVDRFLSASALEQQREIAEAEAKQKESLDQANALVKAERNRAEQAQRDAARLRRWVASTILLLVVAVGLTVFAFLQVGQVSAARVEAEEKAANARAAELRAKWKELEARASEAKAALSEAIAKKSQESERAKAEEAARERDRADQLRHEASRNAARFQTAAAEAREMAEKAKEALDRLHQQEAEAEHARQVRQQKGQIPAWKEDGR